MKRTKIILGILFLLTFIESILLMVFFLQRPQKLIPKAIQTPSLPIRGQAGDLWADIVLGQRNFNEIQPYETVADRLFLPGGVVIDKTVSPNILYILDSGNSRVLGVNLEECLAQKKADPRSRCQPIRVIGQPDFFSNSCNGDSGFQNYPQRAPAGRGTLCFQPETAMSPNEGGNGAGLFLDKEGNFYLPDIQNNRLLKYQKISTTDNLADEVWGQADFSGNECNRGGDYPSAESLCFSKGYISATAKLDLSGNLWVTDSGNNRVLRFPKLGGNISKKADLVIGQGSFDFRGVGDPLNRLNEPSGLDFDSEGKLYVADQRNNRVLVFSPPFSNGMVGQLFGEGFLLPVDIKIERISPGEDEIWISDVHNGMIEGWNNQGTHVFQVFGKSRYQPDGRQGNELYDAFGSFDFLDSARQLIVSNRVGKYPNNILVFASSQSRSDFRLFSPDEGNDSLYNFIGRRGLDSARGVMVTEDQLIINDKNRILFWNNPENLYDGRPLDGLIGGDKPFLADDQPNFASQGSSKITIKKDEVGNLWTTTSLMGDKPSSIEIYKLPLTTGKRPFKTIGFNPNQCLYTLEGEKICNPDPYWNLTGLVPSANGDFVWVTHTGTNRVFRLRNPLSDNPKIDVILGQEKALEVCCNREKNPDGSCKQWDKTTKRPSLNMLCYPGALSLDNFGNLYVADHYLEGVGNFRILIFRKEDLPIDKKQTIYGVSAFKQIPNIAAFEMAFDAENRLVVGQNGNCDYLNQTSRLVAFFNNPLKNMTGRPDGHFKDLYSISFGATFDKFNNLYVTDHNRGRVLVYKNPFRSPILTPTLSPVPPVITSTLTPVPTAILPSSTPTPTPLPSVLPPRPTATIKLSPTPTPTFSVCPLSISQEKGNTNFTLNNVWRTVAFTVKDSGWVDKIAVKAGNFGGTWRSITCKVTTEEGTDLSVGQSSAAFTLSSGAAWREISFKNNKFKLTRGQNYLLSCKGPDSWNSLYWIWEAALGPVKGKTYRIYLCPTVD